MLDKLGKGCRLGGGAGHERSEDIDLTRDGSTRERCIMAGRNDLKTAEDLVC